jgi:hypothetical protein
MKVGRDIRRSFKRLGYIECIGCGVLQSAWVNKRPTGSIFVERYDPLCSGCKAREKYREADIIFDGRGRIIG